MNVFVVKERISEDRESTTYVRSVFSTQELAQQYIAELKSRREDTLRAQALEMGDDPEYYLSWLWHYHFYVDEFILDQNDGNVLYQGE